MSLLADLLSKVKHHQQQPRKDIPPGLKNIILDSNKKEALKRRIILFSIFSALTIISGLTAVYLMQSYFAGDKIQKTESFDYAQGRHRAQGTPSSQTGQVAQVTKEVGGRQLIVDSQKKRPNTVRTRESKGKENAGEDILEEQSVKEEAQPVQEEKTQQAKVSAAGVEKPKVDPSEKDAYIYMARSYELKKDYSNALSSYKRVLNIEPKNYRIMNNIAYIFLQLNSFEEAMDYLQMAINVANNYVPALINMGIVHARLGRPSEAEGYLSRAVVLEPYNKHALFNIAFFHEGQGNYDRSQDYYLRLQRTGDIHGYLGLARIKEKLGRTDDAIKIYRDASRIENLDSETRKLINERIRILEVK